MSDSGPDAKDSITEVAEESFVREQPLQIERGAVLAGRYQVEEVIGKGGSGVVLRVFDRTVQNVVALKVLKSELARDSKWDKRFSRELRLGRPIQHPNVCRIFDIGEADGHRFLTMELATGGSLRDELKRRPALERPIADRLADARAAIEGLAAIHATGVVHRDFKPDNLLRMEDGRLVISDFGLATDAPGGPGVTVMIGTPHYMAPEVLAGEPATSRSDVWALGVVLHEIVFGRRPERQNISFDGTSQERIRPQLAVERAVLEMCRRCMAEASMDRPLDAGVVEAQFALLSRGGRPIRRRRRMWIVGAASLALIGLWIQRARHSRSTDTVPAQGGIASIQVAGVATDWANVPILAEFPGRVHCVSPAPANAVTVVWGDPRRADTIEVSGGARHASPLASETYRIGCPDLAADGRRVLYTAQTPAGAREIRMSTRPDGADAVTITSGAEPVWLTEDEFLYDLDVSHVAVFSLPTNTVVLVPGGDVPETFALKDKAVGPGEFAVLYSNGVGRMLGLFDSRDLHQLKLLNLDGAMQVRFGRVPERVLISYQASGDPAMLVDLDWRSSRAAAVGRYAGYEVSQTLQIDDATLVVARRTRTDAWYADDRGDHRLTTDGQTYSVSIRGSGEALLGRGDSAGHLDVWLLTPDGRQERLTRVGAAAAPAFDGAGRDWAYTDYSGQSIVWCADLSAQTCRVVYRDASLPTAPAFSPDGRLLSIMTQLRQPKVIVLSNPQGGTVGSWDGSTRCPPIWSRAGTVWTLAAPGGHFLWIEHRPDGRKTGNTVPFEEGASRGEQCWPAGVAGPLRIRRSWTVREEVSRLLKVSGKFLEAHEPVH